MWQECNNIFVCQGRPGVPLHRCSNEMSRDDGTVFGAGLFIGAHFILYVATVAQHEDVFVGVPESFDD